MVKKLGFIIPALFLVLGITMVNVNCGGGEVKVEAKVETPPPPPPPPPKPKEEPKVVEKSQEDPWLEFLNNGDMAWEQRDYERARAAYQQALELGAPQGRVSGRLGYCANRLDNNKEEALQRYEEAVAKNFDNPIDKADVFKWRGHVLFNQGNTEASKADFQASLEINSNDVVASYGLALCKFEEEDYDGAISLLNKAIENSQAHHPALNLRGKCNLKKENYDLATKDFSKALELSPDEPIYILNKGLSSLLIGNYEDALNYLTEAENKGMKDPELYAALGDLYLTVVWKGNDKVKAQEYIKKANELNENENQAERYSNLSIILEKSMEKDKKATTTTTTTKKEKEAAIETTTTLGATEEEYPYEEDEYIDEE